MHLRTTGPATAPQGVLSRALSRTGRPRALGPRAAWITILALSVLGGCRDSSASVVSMRLENIRPAHGAGVYLNEELVLTFSQPLDPMSISSTSLRIVDGEGRGAQGRWDVVGRQARFVPRPVLAQTLDDGGYRPGTAYTLEVAGFPRLDGLRSTSGASLDHPLSWPFKTVEVDEGGRNLLFDDASPGRGAMVKVPASRSLHPGEALVLECPEPLDPSSLQDEQFRIERLGQEQVEFVCAVKARFLANHPEGSRGLLEPCALIELMPVERLSPGNYLLAARDVSLTDYGGNAVWPAALSRSSLAFRVISPPPFGPSAMGVEAFHQLSFLDRAGFLSVAVPGTDGLAHWGDRGTLSVRYPRAAGNGELGAVVLEGAETRADVQATGIEIPSQGTLDLGQGTGLRVLRSQGRLLIAGKLERRVEAPGEEEPRSGPDRPGHPYVDFETLSSWMERAQTEDWTWTVLIAGGDLVIEGEVEVNTPLLLVAGGWIRVEGRVDQPPGQLWLLSEGGGLRMDPTASIPDIVLDAPLDNPLRTTLHLAAVSAPLPAKVKAYRWLDAEVGGRHGKGRYEVSFLPATGPVDRARAVTHPRLLEGEGQVRVLLELFVSPGPLWDPPSVDFVNLFWAPNR